MTPEFMPHPLANRVLRVLCASAALGLVFIATTAHAQQGESAAQKPFIMILMDTSGSMEWTDEGDEHYPKLNGSSWELGKELIAPDGATRYYGPCRVWETNSCENYYRPTWNWGDNEYWLGGSETTEAVTAIRGTDSSLSPYRLDNNSQPRHVTLKEILTGDMVLKPKDDNRPISSFDPGVYGPGCWIVPRQRGTDVNGSVCAGTTSKNFEKFPDHTDPQPHFQEVFDGQHPNGLMDTMSRSAIFGLAMFDSYQDSGTRPNGQDSLSKDWEGGNYGGEHIDDNMPSGFAGIYEGEGGEINPNNRRESNYNLGVYQMVAPKKFDMGADIASDISTFVQYALVDAGYLKIGDSHQLKISSSQELGGGIQESDQIIFSDSLADFLNSYQLGKQPVVGATPLAAAIYDIHQFFAEGSPSTNSNRSDSRGPVMDDRYRECRPKQVVMLTDGTPEPERAGGRASLGNDSLNSAFGYNKAQYPYSNTEDAIDFFVRDRQYSPTFDAVTGDTTFDTDPGPRSTSDSYLTGSWSDSSSSNEYRKAVNYNPRVHIVGLTGQEISTTANPINPAIELEEIRVIRKMAEMAISGRTCASFYLGKDYIPEGYGTGNDAGRCDPKEQICLDKRQADYMSQRSFGEYKYLARDGTDPVCEFPALIFAFPTDPDFRKKSNLVERTTAGLQLLFNHIVSSGLSSRTRPTFVNRLDDRSRPEGGQFRYFSGVNVEPGSVFWKGQLFRQTHLCPDATSTIPQVTTVDLAEQVNDLAGEVEWNQDVRTEATLDKRRIFTTFSKWNPHYYTTPPLTSAYPATADTRFSMGVGYATLANYSGNDTLKEGYLRPATSNMTGSRVPLDEEDFNKISEKFSSREKSHFKYFHTDRKEDLQYLVDEIRGRTPEKQGRALGAIVNASPVAVEPPDRSLPIESYREFQSQFANRPSMLYVATTDGFLHALYAGGIDSSDNKDKVPSGAKDGGMVSKDKQREAWAYLPQMLHNKLAGFKGKHAYLLDGTPTVQDVRLCQHPIDGTAYNDHEQACKAEAITNPGSYEGFLGAFQWRTVLVQGLGSAGEGYFAMDITRPGGEALQQDGSYGIEAPDPIPLWEFDPVWEHYQVAKLVEKGGRDVVYPGSNVSLGKIKDHCDAGTTDINDKFWNQSFMGNSVGEAAIGTVVVDAEFTSNPGTPSDRLRRPVAVFSGGAAEQNPGKCREHRMGKAIYVVDMQTGSLLRRFVSYESDGTGAGSEKLFEHPVTGSPALYDSRPGSLVTRGFVGDASGRMFRIDLSNSDPEKWYVQMFFDPYEHIDTDSNDANITFGPAAFKPALAKSTNTLNNDLLVFYGLGETGDLSVSDTKQLMIAVRESISTTPDGTTFRATIKGEKLWHREFQTASGDKTFNEKLTGAPVVFNSGVYFTTYVEPGEDACAPGWSRIYGMTFQGDLDPADPKLDNIQPKGLFRAVGTTNLERGQAHIPPGTKCFPGESNGQCMAYEPEKTADLQEAIVVRGLTITQGQTCNPIVDDDPIDPGSKQTKSSQQPTLMAQSTSSEFSGGSSAPAVGGGGGGTGGGGGDGIFAIEQDIAKTTSGYNPLSWAVIDN